MIDWLVIVLFVLVLFELLCLLHRHIWSPDAKEAGPTIVFTLIHAATSCIDVCFELQEDDILREQIRIHGIDDK